MPVLTWVDEALPSEVQMVLTLTRTHALRAARSYAARHDVPWVGVTRVRTYRSWWLVTAEAYEFEVDTGGKGDAVVAVWAPFGGVARCEFRPSDPSRCWLPPWATYPGYTSVTMNWRQGTGEVYLRDWWRWYLALPVEQQVAYRTRFPEPDRDGWPGFYVGWRV